MCSYINLWCGGCVDNARSQPSRGNIRQDFQIPGVEEFDSVKRNVVRRSNVHEAAVDAKCLGNQFMNYVRNLPAGFQRESRGWNIRGASNQRAVCLEGIYLDGRWSIAG